MRADEVRHPQIARRSGAGFRAAISGVSRAGAAARVRAWFGAAAMRAAIRTAWSAAWCAAWSAAASTLLLASRPVLAGDDGPAGAAGSPGAAVETPPPPPEVGFELTPGALDGHYVVVPVVGAVGTDVTLEAISLIAARVSAARPSAVVLLIDSDSGSDETALRMAAILKEVRAGVPVIAVVQRAVGASALLVPVATRVFLAEPVGAGPVISYEPEVRPASDMPVGAQAAASRSLLAAAAALSAAGFKAPADGIWSLTAAEAYRSGFAEPLERGIPTLGRHLGIEPWVSAGRQAEAVVRQTSLHDRAIRAYRGRLVGRAFTALQQSNDAISQLSAAEQAAIVADPRRSPVERGYRAAWNGSAWVLAGESSRQWQRTLDGAISAWSRVSQLVDQSAQLLRQAEADTAALVASASTPPADGAVGDTVERLTAAQHEVASRLEAAMSVRSRAEAEVRALGALRQRAP